MSGHRSFNKLRESQAPERRARNEQATLRILRDLEAELLPPDRRGDEHEQTFEVSPQAKPKSG
jgi:hypothetical protein